MKLRNGLKNLAEKTSRSRLGRFVARHMQAIRQKRLVRKGEKRKIEMEAAGLLGDITAYGKTISTLRGAIKAKQSGTTIEGKSAYNWVRWHFTHGLEPSAKFKAAYTENPYFWNSSLAILRSFGKIPDATGTPYTWTVHFLERAMREGKQFIPETVEAIQEISESRKGPITNLDFESVFERAELLEARIIKISPTKLENKKRPKF